MTTVEQPTTEENPLTAGLDLSEADLRLSSLEAASLSELVGRAEAARAQ